MLIFLDSIYNFSYFQELENNCDNLSCFFSSLIFISKFRFETQIMISVKISLKFVKKILHITVIIKNWIIGYCNSRVIIGLAIMGYKPLFYVCAWRQVKPEVFWYNVTFHLFLCNNFGKIYLHFGAFFNETIIPLALVGYEMIIANLGCLSSHIQCVPVE